MFNNVNNVMLMLILIVAILLVIAYTTKTTEGFSQWITKRGEKRRCTNQGNICFDHTKPENCKNIKAFCKRYNTPGFPRKGRRGTRKARAGCERIMNEKCEEKHPGCTAHDLSKMQRYGVPVNLAELKCWAALEGVSLNDNCMNETSLTVNSNESHENPSDGSYCKAKCDNNEFGYPIALKEYSIGNRFTIPHYGNTELALTWNPVVAEKGWVSKDYYCEGIKDPESVGRWRRNEKKK